MKYVLPVQLENPSPLFLDIIKGYKKPLRRMIVCLKWNNGSRNAKKHLRNFAEKLIDRGVDIFFAYGDSNSYNEDSYKYKNGVIIENLGDLINNSLYPHRVYAGSCDVFLFDTLVRQGYNFRVNREIIDDSVLIPAN